MAFLALTVARYGPPVLCTVYENFFLKQKNKAKQFLKPFCLIEMDIQRIFIHSIPELLYYIVVEKSMLQMGETNRIVEV